MGRYTIQISIGLPLTFIGMLTYKVPLIVIVGYPDKSCIVNKQSEVDDFKYVVSRPSI